MLKWERLNADDEIDVTDDMTRAHAGHHRPVRLRLSLQLVLPRRQPSLRRCHVALAGDHHADARAAAGRPDPPQGAAPAARRHPLHARHGRDHHQGAARQRRGPGTKKDLLDFMLSGRRQADRPAARRHPDSRRDHHLPDRRARDDQRAAVVRHLRAAQPPRGAGQSLRRGRSRAGARPVVKPDLRARSTSSPTSRRS